MTKHGEYNKDNNCRWCDVHGWHGWLYACEYYNKETLSEIERQDIQLCKNIRELIYAKHNPANPQP